MKKLLFPLFLIIGYGPILVGQSIPPILERAAAENRAVIIHTLSGQSIYPLTDLPSNFSNTGASFIKTKDHLFMLPQGTGRIYQLEGLPGKRKWKRIDSTFFTGYNFGCFPFSLDGQLYSFGGHGFWHSSGNLRFYNETAKEWNAKVLSESIPWVSNYQAYAPLYFDSANKKISIIASGIAGDNMVKNPINPDYAHKVYQLDIPSGTWTTIGTANDTAHLVLATLPWGIFVNHTSVIDFKHNQYLRFSDSVINKIVGITSKAYKYNPIFLCFAIDSTIYFGSQSNAYDSLVVSRTDLIETGIPIYAPVQKTLDLNWSDAKTIIIIILVLVIVTLSILYWKNIPPKPLVASVSLSSNNFSAVAEPDTEPEKSVSFRSTRILDLLEEREKSLLEFIYKHSIDERLTTIDEINRVIGVANRSNEIQKRMRSDLIGSINQKLNIITKDRKPVIDKQRSEFDKRSFEYFIQPVHMELVEKVLGKK